MSDGMNDMDQKWISKDSEVIKIYGNGCSDCKKIDGATRDTNGNRKEGFEYNHVTPVELLELAKKYNVMSAPICVKDEEVIQFNEVLSLAIRSK